MAGILRTHYCGKRKFVWPRPIELVFSAKQLLKKRGPDENWQHLPPKSRDNRSRNLAKSYWSNWRGKIDVKHRFVVGDGACTEQRALTRCDMMPTITASRASGLSYWLLHRGRYEDIEEVASFQGIDLPTDYGTNWELLVSRRQWGLMVGNCLSVNVTERVLGRLLFAAGLVDRVVDRWCSEPLPIGVERFRPTCAR